MKVKHKKRNGRIYTNIVDAEKLDPEYQELVEAKHRHAKDIQGTSDVNSNLEAYDPFSNQQTEKVSMEDMEAPDPYTHGANNGDLFESDNRLASHTPRSNRRGNYKRVLQTSEDHLDEEDDEFEVYLCDACNDTGCEECGIDIVLDTEEDFCIVCDGGGCEYCTNDTEDNERND